MTTRRFSIFLSLLISFAACDLSAETSVSTSRGSGLAESVETYWQAVSKRDWETTYKIDLEQPKESDAEGSAKEETAPEAEKSPEKKLEDYIKRKDRALGRMISFEIVEVREDEGNASGSAQMRIRKPIKVAMGYAQKELSFIDHWALADGVWRRLGTQGGDVSSDIVAAPGVRSARTDEERAQAQTEAMPAMEIGQDKAEAGTASPEPPAGDREQDD